MIVTMAHLHWYQERSLPSWLNKVRTPRRSLRGPQFKVEELVAHTTIHDLINLQVPKPEGYPHNPKTKKPVDHEVHNLLRLIRMALSNEEDLHAYLQHLLDATWTHEPRLTLVKRMLRHLRRAS